MSKFRIFIILPFIISSIFAKSLTEIDKEIAVAKTRIEQNKNRELSLQSRTENLSVEIATAKKNLKKIEREISQNNNEISTLEEIANNEKNEKIKLTKERDWLLIEKNNNEKELIDLVSNHLIEAIVLSNSNIENEKDLILQQLYRAANTNMKNKIASAKRQFLQKVREIGSIEHKISQIESRLSKLVEARNKQKELQKKQASQIKDLDRQKSKYLSELNKLIHQKNAERQMLADLSILRQQTVDQLRQKQISKQEAKTLEASTTNIKNVEVKLYGNSYQKASRSNYNGQKVKAPLDDRFPIKLVKKFGPYTDPIYNIKIHNDSITLKSTKDSVVRSVLPGKVIFADDLKLLGKVVIVEHNGNMHTIYRNLDSISPNIKKNRMIAQRESIGRITNELVFEVTKNGLPINPLQLIALK